jgi:effector-binding domain-containing protein
MLLLKKIAVSLVLGCVVLLLVAFLLPRRVHVERSAVISAPRATVFALVNGFKRFNDFSPWATLDPKTVYSVSGPESGVGAKMIWKGDPKKVGTGTQEVIESRPIETVAMSLDFGPEGQATTRFTLRRAGDATNVTWSFDTDLGMNPVSRYFGLLFDSMIGRDYEKGLAKLKELAEALPKADFEGLHVERVEAAPILLASVEAECGRDEEAVSRALGAAYGELARFLKAHGLRQAGPPITVNHRFDASGYAFEAAMPIDRRPAKEPPAAARIKVRQTRAGTALKVVHRGPYREMGATYDKLLAFAAAHAYAQDGPPWDEFVSDPATTPEAERVTHVFLPVRGVSSSSK